LASSDEVLSDTLLADLHWQITFGAVWAIPACGGDHLKMEREGKFNFGKKEIIY
jgi:hypothetical protein